MKEGSPISTRDAIERVTAQIAGTLSSRKQPVALFPGDTRLGAPGLGLTRNESIELVLTLENRLGVHLPHEQTGRLEAMTIGELTTAFAALLDDRSSAGVTQLPTREDILVLVAEARGLEPHEVSEDIDSLTRMWLLHSLEQRYRTPLEIPNSRLADIDSVDGAVRVLRDVLQRTGPIHLRGKELVP